MPYLFDYQNYREFLRDFYHSKKAKNPKFSYRLLSRIFGFASPNFLKLVIEGDRNLTESSIEKISNGLKLKHLESNYFKVLVLSNQCKKLDEKQHLVDRLSYLLAKAKERHLDQQFQTFLSRWYYPVIREMTLLSQFKEDPQWIALMLNGEVSADQIQICLSDLLEMGLLKRIENEKLVPAEKNLSTSPEAIQVALKGIHKDFIDKARHAVDLSAPQHRDISSLTVSMNKESFEKSKKLIRKFRQDLNIFLSKQPHVDTVYQINFQLFNLTPIPWNRQMEKTS